MLNEIAATRTMLTRIGDQLTHRIELMEARKDDALHDLRIGVVLHANEALDDIEQAVRGQDLAVRVVPVGQVFEEDLSVFVRGGLRDPVMV